MSLSSLPSELIFHISRLIAPSAIENWGRTCHRIRSIAEPLIKEHRKLLTKYTKISLNNAAAAKTLFEICAHPWIALYPHTLEVIANRKWRTLEWSRNVRQAAVVEEVAMIRSLVDDEDIKDLLRRTRLIPADEEERWLEEIEKGNEDYLFALMLACLPNLQRLTIRLDFHKLEKVKDMIRTIKLQPLHSPALSSLRSVHVLEKDASSSSCDLEILPLVAALPGLQHVQGRNLVGLYRECYRDGWLTYPGATPSITHIYLETCGMSVEGLQMLCDSLKGLLSFKYVAHRAGWGLHAIADLLRNARSTLHTLEISTGAGASRYIGPLRGFTALKHLTVDSDMLMKNGKMQRAVDILPASIETVTLAGNQMTKPNEDVFLGDLYRPSFMYPHLKSIGIEDSYGRRLIGKDRLKFQKEFHTQTSPSWLLRYR